MPSWKKRKKEKFLSQNSESEMKNIHWMQDHLANVSTIIVSRQKTPLMQQNLQSIFWTTGTVHLIDSKVTILENVKDLTLAQLERREDYWISTLGTQHSQGLNKRANTELSGIYHCLFG